MALGFQVAKQGIQLVVPHIRRLSALRGRTYSAASALLFELMQLGLYLVPQLRDAEPAGLHIKVYSCTHAVRVLHRQRIDPVHALYCSCRSLLDDSCTCMTVISHAVPLSSACWTVLLDVKVWLCDPWPGL